MKKTAFVKIDKKDRDLVSCVCIECAIKVSFYTVEENEQILLTEFTVDDYGQLFIIGRMLEIKLQIQAL